MAIQAVWKRTTLNIINKPEAISLPKYLLAGYLFDNKRTMANNAGSVMLASNISLQGQFIQFSIGRKLGNF